MRKKKSFQKNILFHAKRSTIPVRGRVEKELYTILEKTYLPTGVFKKDLLPKKKDTKSPFDKLEGRLSACRTFLSLIEKLE